MLPLVGNLGFLWMIAGRPDNLARMSTDVVQIEGLLYTPLAAGAIRLSFSQFRMLRRLSSERALLNIAQLEALE